MDMTSTVTEGPRSDQPVRRSFTPAQKLEYLAAYETASEHNQGGAYLRQEALYFTTLGAVFTDAFAGEVAQPGSDIGGNDPP